MGAQPSGSNEKQVSVGHQQLHPSTVALPWRGDHSTTVNSQQLGTAFVQVNSHLHPTVGVFNLSVDPSRLTGQPLRTPSDLRFYRVWDNTWGYRPATCRFASLESNISRSARPPQTPTCTPLPTPEAATVALLWRPARAQGRGPPENRVDRGESMWRSHSKGIRRGGGTRIASGM